MGERSYRKIIIAVMARRVVVAKCLPGQIVAPPPKARKEDFFAVAVLVLVGSGEVALRVRRGGGFLGEGDDDDDASTSISEMMDGDAETWGFRKRCGLNSPASAPQRSREVWMAALGIWMMESRLRR